jgi:hypothetical protein
MRRLFIFLFAPLLAVAVALALALPMGVPPAAAATVNAAYFAESGTISATGGTVAECVAAPDDGKFVQLAPSSWITLKFPDNWAAVPDGTPAADLRIDTYDVPYPADAEILVSLNGTTWTSLGIGSDTANVDLDLVEAGGPVKYVKVDQGTNYIDPAYPTLGFDLDAVVALNAGTIPYGSITSPAEGQVFTGGPISFDAIYWDDDPSGVQWAVRKGTSDPATNTVWGNVDGHSDPYTWDGHLFHSEASEAVVSSWETGWYYAFVWNPVEGSGEPNMRLVRGFYIVALTDLTPSVSYNPVNTFHSVFAVITPALADVAVAFEVTGANTASGTVHTDASGVAEFSYQGLNEGHDTITATLGDVTLTADKYWLENFVTGGGVIRDAKGKPQWTLGGNVGVLDGAIVGQFQIQDHVNKVSCHCSSFDELQFSGGEATSPPASHNTAMFKGTFVGNDGSEKTVRVTIQDLGEPGAGVDTVALGCGLSLTQTTISGGNFQVHDIPETLVGTWLLEVNGSTYDHDMFIVSQDPSGAITGYGGYPAGSGPVYPYPYNWTLVGQVTGSNVEMTLSYQSTYTATITGTIAPDWNSMSGGAGTGGVTDWIATRVG